MLVQSFRRLTCNCRSSKAKRMHVRPTRSLGICAVGSLGAHFTLWGAIRDSPWGLSVGTLRGLVEQMSEERQRS